MRRTILLLLLTLGLVQGAHACPDLTGRYRIGYQSNLDPNAYRGILTALRLVNTPGGEIDLEISSTSGGRTIAVGLLAHPTDRKERPRARLSFGADYDCKDGVVSLLAPFDDSRKSGDDYLEGTTVVSMRRGSGGGLAVTLQFTGSQGMTLYSYDSARLSIPLPHTRRRLVETSELMPAHLAPAPPDPAELVRKSVQERTLVQIRSKVESVIGASSIGSIRTDSEGIRLRLIARDSDQMLQTEDRLLKSDLSYAVVTEPFWQRQWVFEILLHSSGRGAVQRPSAFRVEKELEKLLCRPASVVNTKRTGEDYEARVALAGMTAAEAANCITGRSNLISEVIPIGTERDYLSSGGQRELSVWRLKVAR